MSLLDVVIFGATGFTGQHAVEQLARIASQRGLSWAVAGRSRDKLLNILKNILEQTEETLSSTKILIADVQNEQSLRDMCRQTRVLVNCCGPYNLYGEVVVKAAIHSRTHYVDVSGEPYFIESMQLKYEQAARDAGVYVVSACGFESIIADLGVIYLQQNFGGVLNSVESYTNVKMLAGSINYGSWDSLICSLSHASELHAMRKNQRPSAPILTPVLKSRPTFHKRLGGWCVRVLGNDSSAVYRTQRYFHEADGTRPAQFKSYAKCDSLRNAVATVLVFILVYVMSQFRFMRKILREKSKIFSAGITTATPSKNVAKNMGFEVILYGSGWDENDASNIGSLNLPPNKSVIAKISGTNPAYGMTVTGLLYSAVAILEEPHNMPPGGGILTPGIAFAKTNLVKNLQDNEVIFQVVYSNAHQY